MLKIKYPYKNDSEKEKFLDDYYNLFKNQIANEILINSEIGKIDSNWDLKKLLTTKFEDLVDFAEKSITQNTDSLKTFFYELNSKGKKEYTYSKMQRKIADFLIEKKLELCSCHYCNIDFVNAFNSFIEYRKIEDFIENATIEEWQELVSESKGKTIYEEIKINGFRNINNLKKIKNKNIGKKTLAKITINDINSLKKIKDHFTLDHFLPKNEFPFLSLSIYNLIPSCYSCNSKFKGSKEFILSPFLNKICPSSESFDMESLLQFKLNFDVNELKFSEKIEKIEQVEDVEINIKNINLEKDIDVFLNMFQLKGRYKFHKSLAYELIDKRKKYPEKQIEEIERLFSKEGILIDKETFKKHIFGSIIFEKENKNEPFEKYKKEIAKQLGII